MSAATLQRRPSETMKAIAMAGNPPLRARRDLRVLPELFRNGCLPACSAHERASACNSGGCGRPQSLVVVGGGRAGTVSLPAGLQLPLSGFDPATA